MNPEQCPQGAQALYLVERFDTGIESLPTFETKEEWYSIPYSVTGRGTEEVCVEGEGSAPMKVVVPQEV
jgi:hypothetical protein